MGRWRRLGIEEFVVEFLPGLVAQDGVENLAGTLHLHATDGPAEWWIDLDAHAPARPQHAEADTAVRASQVGPVVVVDQPGTPGHHRRVGQSGGC